MGQDEALYAMVQELRRGTLVLCVLTQLEVPMYGYSLVSTLGDKGVPTEANTLYPLLRRLEGQGLLESSWETGGSKPRKYYKTTQQGRAVRQALHKAWDETVKSVERVTKQEEDISDGN